MIKITLDSTTRAKLNNLAQTLEIYDEQGKVLGYYSPVFKQDKAIYEGVDIPISEDDVQQLLRQPPGRPLADILADLEKQP